MLTSEAKRQITSLFEDAIEANRRRIYFDKYHSAQSLDDVQLAAEFSGELGKSDVTEGEINIESARLLNVGGNSVVFFSQREGVWFVIYSSLLKDAALDRIKNLAKHKGWLLNAWIPGDVVDQIYDEFSPEDESVSLTRDWDPYHLYKQNPKIPESLRQYFAENEREFAEQKVEIEVDSPKWLLEESLGNVMTPFLEEKSETTESSFTMEAPPEMGVKSDGGVRSQSPVQSNVKVSGDAQITHSSGDIGATLKLVDETTERTLDVYDRFKELSAMRKYEENDDGSYRVVDYAPPETLRVRLIDHEFDEKSSIKLANFLTVGQRDVDLYGVVVQRKGLEFTAETYVPFNDDRYDIVVAEDEGDTALFIRPTDGSTTGLVYLYRKIQEKIHPSTESEVVASTPELMEGT